MPTFKFRALDHAAQPQNGTLAAANESELARFLSLQGLTLVEARQRLIPGWGEIFQPKFSEQKLRDFTYLLKLVYVSGIPLLSGLQSIMEAQTDPALRDTIQYLHDGVESGKSLSVCLEERPAIFPDYYVQMIRAGESSGTLDKSVDGLLSYLEWQADFSKTVRGFFIYPLTIFSILILLGGVLVIFVFPGLLKVFNKLDIVMPLPTRIVMGISTFAQHYWLLLLGGAVAAFIWIKLWSRTPDGRKWLDGLVLALPVVGRLVVKINLSHYFRTLAALYGAGLEIQQTFLAATAVLSNQVLRDKLGAIPQAIAGGETIHRAMLSLGMFQGLVVEMVGMGEQTGNLDSALLRVCSIYDREVPETIKKVFAVIEPLTVVVMGGVVLMVLLAFFLPIYSIVGGIHGR